MFRLLQASQPRPDQGSARGIAERAAKVDGAPYLD